MTAGAWWFAQSGSSSLAGNAGEVGPLSVFKPCLCVETGQPWQWRGFSDFLLFYRYLTGVNINPHLDERIELGANVLRVLSMVAWDNLSPLFYPSNFPDYFEKLPAFVDLLASRGLRLELTIFADAQIVMPNTSDRDAHQAQVIEKIKGKWNVTAEVANEPFKNLPGGEPEAVERAQSLKGCGVLVASGSYNSRSETDWRPMPPGDYGTTHCGRNSQWPRYCHDLMELTDAVDGSPWVGDEPMGCGEVETGSRDPNPDNHAWYAAGSTLQGAGSTFHCDDGLNSLTPIGPTQRKCALAFFEAIKWVPPHAQLWPYQRGGDAGTGGVGNMPIEHDDAHELRSYCKGDGSREWCIQIQTDREHATPRDGWVVVSEPRKGFVYLERPGLSTHRQG
jgi:hypothetical protein